MTITITLLSKAYCVTHFPLSLSLDPVQWREVRTLFLIDSLFLCFIEPSLTHSHTQQGNLHRPPVHRFIHCNRVFTIKWQLSPPLTVTVTVTLFLSLTHRHTTPISPSLWHSLYAIRFISWLHWLVFHFTFRNFSPLSLSLLTAFSYFLFYWRFLFFLFTLASRPLSLPNTDNLIVGGKIDFFHLPPSLSKAPFYSPSNAHTRILMLMHMMMINSLYSLFYVSSITY